MNLESLLDKLEQIRVREEADEFNEESGFAALLIIETLIQYIGNKKVEDKINEISF